MMEREISLEDFRQLSHAYRVRQLKIHVLEIHSSSTLYFDEKTLNPFVNKSKSFLRKLLAWKLERFCTKINNSAEKE